MRTNEYLQNMRLMTGYRENNIKILLAQICQYRTAERHTSTRCAPAGIDNWKEEEIRGRAQPCSECIVMCKICERLHLFCYRTRKLAEASVSGVTQKSCIVDGCGHVYDPQTLEMYT